MPTKCSQTLFVLKTVRCHGMPDSALQNLFQPTTLTMLSNMPLLLGGATQMHAIESSSKRSWSVLPGRYIVFQPHYLPTFTRQPMIRLVNNFVNNTIIYFVQSSATRSQQSIHDDVISGWQWNLVITKTMHPIWKVTVERYQEVMVAISESVMKIRLKRPHAKKSRWRHIRQDNCLVRTIFS